jgi:hypothetical protein
MIVALAAGLPTCLFDGKETEGLPCTSNEHCGVGIECIAGVCGGDNACASGVPVCSGPKTLQSCVNGMPLDQHCDEICAGQGLGRALTCEFSPQSGRDGCYCDQASSFCDAEGELECWSGNDGRVCQDGVWQNLDCDYVCDLDGLGSGTSCGPNMVGDLVCFCTDPCEDGAQFCLDGTTERYCDQGTWVDVPCQDSSCDSGVSLGCGYLDAIGDETCLCGV